MAAAGARGLRLAGLNRVVREVLFPLVPMTGRIPCFLTPLEGLLGMEAGLAAVRSAPPGQVPPGVDVAEVVAGLRAYHRVAIAPYGEALGANVDLDRALRCHDQRAGGIDRLLAGFWPMARWRAPVLEVAGVSSGIGGGGAAAVTPGRGSLAQAPLLCVPPVRAGASF